MKGEKPNRGGEEEVVGEEGEGADVEEVAQAVQLRPLPIVDKGPLLLRHGHHRLHVKVPQPISD